MTLHFWKNTAIILGLFCLLSVCGGCASKTAAPSDPDALIVVASIFPPYDLARAICGDLAEVSLLVPPGGDSHSFEPNPSDIAKITNADIFFYTGDVMEPWAAKLLAGINAPNLLIVDLSQTVPLENSPTTADDGHGHAATIDPHIWTSPINIQMMLNGVYEAFVSVDTRNQQSYKENLDASLSSWQTLDARFRDIVSKSARQDFIFGSRFACSWFAQEYGLLPDSPYASCSGETEPGVRDMARVIDLMKEKQIPFIFHQELTDEKIAATVAEASGAKLLLFHSCHNVSKEDFVKGVTCLSLMQDNATRLEEGLN